MLPAFFESREHAHVTIQQILLIPNLNTCADVTSSERVAHGMASARSESKADPRRVKIMMSQYKEFHKRASPHQIAFPDEKDINMWYVLICNLSDVHEFGEYFIKFSAGPEFPQKAPKDFQLLTENGVFEMGGAICLSMGEFHDKDTGRSDVWRAALGMPGFAENVANAMISYRDLGGGIRIRSYDKKSAKKFDKKARQYARDSQKFNFAHNPGLHKRLEEFIAENPENPAVKGLLIARGKLAASTAEVADGPKAGTAAKLPDTLKASPKKAEAPKAGTAAKPPDAPKAGTKKPSTSAAIVALAKDIAQIKITTPMKVEKVTKSGASPADGATTPADDEGIGAFLDDLLL